MRHADASDPLEATQDPSGSASHDAPITRDRRATTSDGSTVGRYALRGVLGRGGMGVVHEAFDPHLGRKVALKLLHKGMGRRHAERFVREARALAQLSHPNVVQVFEVGQHGDRWFIAMELIAGRTLRDWQRDRPSWRECVRTYLQAGQGLAAAHAVGLTHRDFKPGNCIIDDHGRVRVLDFGLAHQAGENSSGTSSSPVRIPPQEPISGSLTRTGEVLGTLAYMPFEQLNGRPTDARSDQWSFCASLYEALYGERPIQADGMGALTIALMKEQIRPAPRGSSVPRRLRRVLLRGLAKDPETRWPSMDALLAELARIEARRTRWVLGSGAVLVVGVGLGLGLLPDPPPPVVPVEASDPPTSVAEGQSLSPEAIGLREWAEEAYASHRNRAIVGHLDRLVPEGMQPDDPSLAAEMLLWRGRLHPDPKEGVALLRRAYFLAQQAELPSIEARAAALIADNPEGAHAEGVAEWTRLAWAAVERVPWDRSATVELVVTVANATAQVAWIMGKEHTRAVLEFADSVVGGVTLEDDTFVAWQLAVLSSAWREFGDHERALHWALAEHELLSAVADPLHPQWGNVNEQIGRALRAAGPLHCAEALPYLDAALAIHLRHGLGEAASTVRLEIAGCLRDLGRLEAALEQARGATEHWAEHRPKFMTFQQRAHLLAARLLKDLGRIDDARAELEHLLSLVDLDSSTDVVRDDAKQMLARLGGKKG